MSVEICINTKAENALWVGIEEAKEIYLELKTLFDPMQEKEPLISCKPGEPASIADGFYKEAQMKKYEIKEGCDCGFCAEARYYKGFNA